MNFGDYMNANTLVESYLPTFIQLKREKEKEKEKTKEKEKETEYKEFCSALSVFFEEYISILNKAMHKDTSIHDLYRVCSPFPPLLCSRLNRCIERPSPTSPSWKVLFSTSKPSIRLAYVLSFSLSIS